MKRKIVEYVLIGVIVTQLTIIAGLLYRTYDVVSTVYGPTVEYMKAMEAQGRNVFEEQNPHLKEDNGAVEHDHDGDGKPDH